MAFFAITGKTEATRGAGSPESGERKSGSARLALTGIRRSGGAASFAAEPEWLMTRRTGPLESGQKKKRNTNLLVENEKYKPIFRKTAPFSWWLALS
ncbi:hypothetical protein CXF70_14690 [Planomicrobium sp. MB-3u-38]|nr:hypothetical protein CXF70_14690 [Planomicrobium sp. MB-3u-38]